MDPLAPFSEKTRSWFERAFAGPTPAQEAGWPAIASGENVLIQAPTGSGKTLAAFLHGIDTLDRGSRNGSPSALCLAAEGAQLRRRAEPARAARRDQVRPPRRRPHGRYDAEGAAGADQGAAGHPDHDARVAVPDVDLTGARNPARDRDGHRRRGPRRRRHQARRASGAVAGTARRPVGGPSQRIGLSATQRPLEEIGRRRRHARLHRRQRGDLGSAVPTEAVDLGTGAVAFAAKAHLAFVEVAVAPVRGGLAVVMVDPCRGSNTSPWPTAPASSTPSWRCYGGTGGHRRGAQGAS